MISISKMTGKMAGIPAINCNPLENSFCEKMSKVPGSICSMCYSRDMLKTFRQNCGPSWSRNADLLSSKRIDKFDIPRINTAIFRFHGHGELINSLHLENLIFICTQFPRTTFSLYTKRKDIIARVFKKTKKPANLILIFSQPYIDGPEYIPAYFDKTFIATRDSDAVNCDLNCFDCQICYDNTATDVIYELVKDGRGRPIENDN